MSKKRVFISWSGRIGQRLAEGLRVTLLSHPELEPWVSSKDIASGSDWFRELQEALQDASFGLACLTPGSSRSPWLNFEAGYVFSKLSSFKLLRFREQLRDPLNKLQALDGENKEDLVKLLDEMISGGTDQAREWVEFKFGLWKNNYLRLLDEPIQSHMSQFKSKLDELVEASQHMEDNVHFKDNICFQHVVTKSLDDMARQVGFVTDSYSVPAPEYPHYLVSLQRNLRVKVSAVALVDQVEDFWQQEEGREIWESVHKDSERVFVFTTVEDFNRAYDTLLRYASRYRVFAMSYETLAREFKPYAKDFGIIEADQCALFVEYQDTVPVRTVLFTADVKQVDVHKEWLARIVRRAEIITARNGAGLEQDRQRIFARQTTPQRYATVEMSLYLNIDEYDKYAWQHPYFEPVVQRILDLYMHERKTETGSVQVLELGAATGHLTRQLVEGIAAEYAAIELDWVCFRRLQSNLAGWGNVKPYNEDSRTYDPPGTFNYIFSLFSDRRLKLEDKAVYLTNIRRNLKPNGRVFIADEFLRPYDPDEVGAAEQALDDYFAHVIALARNQGNPHVVHLLEALHRAAREQNIQLISWKQYEGLLQDAGFAFQKEKAGPIGDDNVGGVYLYSLWIPS